MLFSYIYLWTTLAMLQAQMVSKIYSKEIFFSLLSEMEEFQRGVNSKITFWFFNSAHLFGHSPHQGNMAEGRDAEWIQSSSLIRIFLQLSELNVMEGKSSEIRSKNNHVLNGEHQTAAFSIASEFGEFTERKICLFGASVH